RDCSSSRMPTQIWIPAVFFPYLVGLGLVFGLSLPYIGLPLAVLTLAGPTGAYIFLRNQKVGVDDRVLTPKHLRHLLSRKAGKLGVKVDAEKKFDYQQGAPVELIAMGGDTDRDNQVNLIKSRQSPAFVVAKNLLADAIDARGEKILLDYSQQGVAVKHQVDGVWQAAEPMDRETGDPMLAVLKTISNLNAAERRARQDGQFGAEYNKAKYACQITSQGVQTGERVVLQLTNKKVQIESLEAAGMRPKMLEQLKEALAGPGGFVLLSAMPTGGLTTSLTLTLKACDRYMRDFFIVEQQGQQEPEVENVMPVLFDKGQTAMTVLPSLLRKDPAFVVVPDISDLQTVGLLCKQSVEASVIVGTMRAKEAVEALLRVLAAKVPAKEFAPVAKAVLNVRLVRKLCESCKQPYAPSADMLKKLGIPPGKVQAFYRPPPPPEDPKEICKVCRGVGYHGRTGIYELLLVSDKLREALIKQPQLETLRKVARAGGHNGVQEEGILMVARGVTSLQELQRVLKQ
ncbi:MAG: Flp pilus assembly complex ATPase component TadA, partial [Planctomycetales bacterium]|nr:Flp pilus assembly complex ATPase component TadA [Planctomycetales bacterium]